MGTATVPVFGLTPDKLPLSEPSREVHPRHEIVWNISEETGVIPVSDKRFSDCRLIGRHRLPTGGIDVVPRHWGIRTKRISTSAGM